MSMLSAQIDRLRELATRYDELQSGAVKAVTMPSDTGSVLREAADTIWQLRDDLQRANAENALLRELMYDRAHVHAIQHMTEDELRITAANALDENRKLRELLQMALTSHYKMCTNRGTCSGCLFFKAKPFAPACPIVSVTRDTRELGVEVTE